MQRKFQPLESEIRWQNLVYVSRAKLEQFGLSLEKRGWRFGKLGIGLSSTPKTDRQLLIEIGRLLQKQCLIRYELDPQQQSYFLVRLVASAGTFWPWSGRKKEMEQVAWWVGEGEHVTVLACGNIKHLRQQGALPDFSTVSTWWPSRVDAYLDLVDSMITTASVENGAPLLSTDGSKVRSFINACFNESVQRNHKIHGPAIFEMLLRVDYVEESENEKPVVFGSPLWVAQVQQPVCGVYNLGGASAGSETEGPLARGIWDGNKWLGTFWEEGQTMPQRKCLIPSESPTVPSSMPESTDIIRLGIPDCFEFVEEEKRLESRGTALRRFYNLFNKARFRLTGKGPA